MAIRLRFAMHGPRHNRIFHLVAINNQLRRNAKPIETLGIFDPKLPAGETHKTVEWNPSRIKYWLSVGAKPTPPALKLLTMGGLITPSEAQ
ncbi:ribosomal protein S16 domain-containing protein [Abortiporus biennis]|nr:ribosomal protein S16 domain-containing protein [Abortiporus biennis]